MQIQSHYEDQRANHAAGTSSTVWLPFCKNCLVAMMQKEAELDGELSELRSKDDPG